MKKQLIIYDLDGTLIDTAADIAAAANHMILTLGGKALSLEEIKSYVGQGLHYLIESCLKSQDPKTLERGSKLYRRHYEQHMLDQSQVYPVAFLFMQKFKNCKQAVLTNKPEPFTSQMLEALEVAPFLFATIAGNSNYPKKPSPEGLFHLIESSGANKETTLFIGDSLIDVQTGENAGVETALLSHGFNSENELRSRTSFPVVPHFQALLELANQKGW